MTNKTKLIWDFRGPDAEQIAEHYKVHLDQFAVTSKLADYTTGIQQITSMYCTAYFEIMVADQEKVAIALRPHRSEEIDNSKE